MRKIHIASAKPGEKMAKPIWAANGSILIGVGVELNERFIERLKNYGIDYIFVEDAATEGIFPEDAIREETRKKAIEAVYKTMSGLTKSTQIKGKVAVPNLGQSYQNIFGEIIQDLAGKNDLMVSLATLHVKEEYLFHHSVNVAVLAGIMGLAKGYNRQQLTELGVGALLFDIGMTAFTDDVWQKSAVLSHEQREKLQKHTEEGFNILRKQYDVSLLSAHCALQHHERYDGTGYPRGLKGNEIHEYAQIVAIADVFDALTSPRSYRQSYSPSEAIEFLFANGNQWFDLELIKVFCSHIAIYPIASTVLLNTGHVGVVTAVNPLFAHRPNVRIIKEPNGNPPASPYDLELSKHANITIFKTL